MADSNELSENLDDIFGFNPSRDAVHDAVENNEPVKDTAEDSDLGVEFPGHETEEELAEKARKAEGEEDDAEEEESDEDDDEEEDDSSDDGDDSEGEEEDEEGEEESDSISASELALLKLKYENLESKLKDKKEAPKPAEPTQPAQPKPEDFPQYALTIPDDIVETIASGDVEQVKEGLQALINGVAAVVHKRAVDEFSTTMREEVPKIAQDQTKQQQYYAHVREDFYGTYPGYKDERYAQFVGLVADKIQRESGSEQWSPTMKKAIAAEMKKITSFNGKAVIANSNDAGPAKGSKKRRKRKGRKPARIVKPGARKSGMPAKGQSDIGDDISSMFADEFARRL